MLDRFLEAGGMFIDTADVYGDGESERTLAPWLARHRDDVVLATKVRFSVSDPGGEGLRRIESEQPATRASVVSAWT
jgi:aryl-alcohol dehydrogenase-like predicted oxidoreductase